VNQARAGLLRGGRHRSCALHVDGRKRARVDRAYDASQVDDGVGAGKRVAERWGLERRVHDRRAWRRLM